MKILVVNSIGNHVIAGIRSLAKKGHVIDVGLPSDKSIKVNKFFKSRYIGNIYKVFPPSESLNNFRDDILLLLKKTYYDVILPFGYKTTLAVSILKPELEEFTGVGVADYKIIDLVHDKEKLHWLLFRNNFVVPKIYRYKSFSELKKIKINYPIVIKARKSCGIKNGVRYAGNYNELCSKYEEIHLRKSNVREIEDYSKPLIQEYIPGKIHDGLFIFNKGKMRAALTQIREITYPLSGGVATNNITTNEPGLVEYGREILEFINWHGPCQLEVKKDIRDGQYKLIEINPKLWGSVDLSIKSGIDFVEKACELARFGDVKEEYNYRTNIKYKWIFPNEIFTIYQDKGNRFRRLLKLFEVFKRNTFTEFDFRDIKPNIFNILKTFYTIFFRSYDILPKGKEFNSDL